MYLDVDVMQIDELFGSLHVWAFDVQICQTEHRDA